MNSRRWFRSLHIFIVLCGRLAHAATDSGLTSTVSSTPTNGEPSSPATPSPGGMEDPNSTEEVALDPTVNSTEEVTWNSTENSTVTPTLSVSEEPTVDTEAPSAPTVQPTVTPQACLCDLTPGFCDIGCCCDTADCDVANLSTVFTGCPQKAISGVCIEKWLMFRANVESSLITVTDSLFCVRPEEKAPQPLPAVLQYPALGDSYHFTLPEPTSTSHSRHFYRVDDVIQTYFSNSSVRGLLRQPSAGAAAAAFCVNRNPAKFLRSVSLSCTRKVTPQSCTTDPNLSARSYFSDLRLIKIPIGELEPVSDFLIPVTPLSDWPVPRQQNNSCKNTVKKVEFVIGYTGRGELTYATVNVALADVDPNQMLLQTHTVQFQLDSPSLTPGGLTAAVGLLAGSPLIGRFDDQVKPLTSLGVSQGGECSSDPNRRAPVLFTYNTIAGCTFSSAARDCSELRSQIYGILQGLATPDVIAMNSGSQPQWTRVITQECPVSLQETCESGCVLPHSLSIQLLWARQGLLDLPQSYILGAKYYFQCQNVQCPLSSSLALTTTVTFADATVYPEPPRSLPQPHWKFPFGFFTRGAAELDGRVVINGSDTDKVTWSLMLFTVMLLTGLEFFIR
ncbi:tectonic-3 isoform X1 [Amphiprion ocellaris]|uniref:tectonic-3 isoform X1 n=1 Tax=Amphiprion ocellaris TaxID=80972 RepID=UPI002410CC28|nr:tectonic-3 isoform X1 [Amphiprion ocellaris]